MSISVILHISNEEPILGEIDELPGAGDNIILVHNPRRRDGKDIHYLADGVTEVYWPWERISFLEVMGDDDEEEIIGFVRE
jgi:hypothetical protein